MREAGGGTKGTCWICRSLGEKANAGRSGRSAKRGKKRRRGWDRDRGKKVTEGKEKRNIQLKICPSRLEPIDPEIHGRVQPRSEPYEGTSWRDKGGHSQSG